MSIKTLISTLLGGLTTACILLLLPVAAQGQNCPTPEVLCSFRHPGSELTAWCEAEDCFEMNFAESLRLVATDDRGDFPWVWNVWTYFGEVSTIGCNLRFNPSNSGKIKLEISGEYGPICRLDVSAGDYMYHHHFGAIPDMPCLGWAECRVLVDSNVE